MKRLSLSWRKWNRLNENGEFSWLHDNVPGAPGREALESFMEEME